MVVRGSLGEIVDDQVVRMADPRTPVESPLVRRRTGTDLNLEGSELHHISFDGRVVYRNDYVGARFSEDDLAVVDLLFRTGAWVRGEYGAVSARGGLPGPRDRAGDRGVGAYGWRGGGRGRGGVGGLSGAGPRGTGPRRRASGNGPRETGVPRETDVPRGELRAPRGGFVRWATRIGELVCLRQAEPHIASIM